MIVFLLLGPLFVFAFQLSLLLFFPLQPPSIISCGVVGIGEYDRTAIRAPVKDVPRTLSPQRRIRQADSHMFVRVAIILTVCWVQPISGPL
jgi:hypothetical protein